MPIRLDSASPDFEQAFVALLGGKRESSQEVGDIVASIIADVRARGDVAVAELTNKFDHAGVTPDTLKFSQDEIDAATARVTPDVMSALQFAHDRIRAHHEKQRPEDHIYTDDLGVTLGTRWTAIDAVGIYVPGGWPPIPPRC